MLLGMLVLSTVVVYVPPIATFVGDRIVLPGQLWRLAWPIPLAAMLTLGWIAYAATKLVGTGFVQVGIPRGVARLLPLALVLGLAVAAWSPAVVGAREIQRMEAEASSLDGRSCFDPILPWLGATVRQPSVVLAPDLENTCIPAYSASANVISLRGGSILGVLPELEERTGGRVTVPQGVSDVFTFYHGPSDEEMVDILRRRNVDYVMVPSRSYLDEDERSRLAKRLERLPFFVATNSPGKTYTLFMVDHAALERYGQEPS